VHVDNLYGGSVLLSNFTELAAGKMICVVTGGAPSFTTAKWVENMDIVAVPKTVTLIQEGGIKKNKFTQKMDSLEFTCASYLSSKNLNFIFLQTTEKLDGNGLTPNKYGSTRL
jgi:hypothetical protein